MREQVWHATTLFLYATSMDLYSTYKCFTTNFKNSLILVALKVILDLRRPECENFVNMLSQETIFVGSPS